ncbi:MAG: transcription elongation factor GreA [Treponema sp.]|nr:transcription elongation factor GreA [Treponema sp.]MDY3755248.1 transcription elongation factor GreA [Treponema sp.]
MSEELVKSVQEMLTEEKWTRATISNYSKNNFIELAVVVENARNHNCIDEIKAICDEHLSHTKQSIIALYISGMLGLKKGTLDNSSLVSLVDIFLDNHKPNVVTYLCESILGEDASNKFALRTLAECYREEGNEKLWDIYETLVRIDHEEADIAKLLAERYEKDGNLEDAIDYYKKAIHRYINNGINTMNQIKELWSKLVSLIPNEIDFFYLVQRKIAKNISEDKSAVLMQELYMYYKNNENWDVAIDIIKLILSIDNADLWARREITDCFRNKHKNHSRLEECIRESGLIGSARNVFDAISGFEKRIAFDTKNFVFHRYWGVGIIQKVTDKHLLINFGKKFGKKEMTSDMAIEALKPLAPDHIWVLKATKTPKDLAKMVKDDKAWALKTIIKSFDNNCDFKRVKAELVPAILTPGEWTSWSTNARRILETDSTFGINPNDINMYTVRPHAISQEEKLSNEFKAQKQFFARIDIFMKYFSSDETDKDSELFTEMFSYFANYLKSFSAVTEQVMASYLVVRKIVAERPHLNPNFKYTFGDLFGDLDDPREMYLSLKDTKNTSLRQDFLNCIRTLLPNWKEIYTKLFPTVLRRELLDQLIANGHVDAVKKLAVESFEDYRVYREAAIFFFRECRNEEWFKEAGISQEKQLVTMIHILNLIYREIANHVDTTDNRKLDRQIQKLIFEERDEGQPHPRLLSYILSNNLDTATRMFTLVDDVRDLDAVIKLNIRNELQKKFPEFKTRGVEEKTVDYLGFLVTAKMLDAKKRELEHITTVEMPANAKEISEAMAQGDLKENAEYKAAKERQNELNNRASRLNEELGKAKIFDPATITTSKVSFGTIVTLKNLQTNEVDEFTILGPWESDPDKKIISFQSPLGSKLMDAKVQETLNFTINDHDYSYEVQEIKKADF